MEQEETVQIGTDGKTDKIVSSSLVVREDKKEDGDMIATRMQKIERHRKFSKLLKEEEEKYKNWPTEGAIEFKDVSMCYHTGPLVLKGISKCYCSYHFVCFNPLLLCCCCYCCTVLLRFYINEDTYFAL